MFVNVKVLCFYFTNGGSSWSIAGRHSINSLDHSNLLQSSACVST